MSVLSNKTKQIVVYLYSVNAYCFTAKVEYPVPFARVKNVFPRGACPFSPTLNPPSIRYIYCLLCPHQVMYIWCNILKVSVGFPSSPSLFFYIFSSNDVHEKSSPTYYATIIFHFHNKHTHRHHRIVVRSHSTRGIVVQ